MGHGHLGNGHLKKPFAFSRAPWYNAGVTNRRTTSKQTRRLLALLLACACLWMGTGAALDHTEDLRGLVAGRTFSHGRAAQSHAAAPAAESPCLACQWQGMASDAQTPALHVPGPPPDSLPRADSLPAPAGHPAFRHTRPRAPPRAAA